MIDLRDVALRWCRERRATVVVSVAGTRGSVPREAGTRMLVAADAVLGTIGGGHLEWQAVDQARRLLAGERLPMRRDVALGPTLGQCCGGALTLEFERLDIALVEAWPVEPPRFALQLYGAGHVGRAIAQALAPLNVEVDWIDEREGEFPAAADWPAGRARIRRTAVDAVEAEVARGAPGQFYLVLTHSHELDLRISRAILERGDFGWFGLIGSQTKRARFLRRFEQHGLEAHVVERMTCPIGVPGVVGKEPEVIAAAVVAQLLLAASAGATLRPPAALESR